MMAISLNWSTSSALQLPLQIPSAILAITAGCRAKDEVTVSHANAIGADANPPTLERWTLRPSAMLGAWQPSPNRTMVSSSRRPRFDMLPRPIATIAQRAESATSEGTRCYNRG